MQDKEIKVFSYNGSSVSFFNGKNVMVNALKWQKRLVNAQQSG